MNEITFQIDGTEIKAQKGSTILQAALNNGIYIPNLCNNPILNPQGACRLCLVEDTHDRIISSCETIIEQGMSISTSTRRVESVREILVRLLVANHEQNCLTCLKNNNCQLQEITSFLGIKKQEMENFRRQVLDVPIDDSNPFFRRDLKKCILCGICVRLCRDKIGVSAVDFGFRGYETRITTLMDKPITESNCVSCGECVNHCPVGALVPKDDLKPSREVKTTCTYCGVGCGIFLGVRGEKIVSAWGDPEHPFSQGNLCVKGKYGFKFVNNPKRLNKPLIKNNGEFKEIEWDEALNYAANELFKYKGDSFASISSARCTNEDNYLLQKFTRVVMGTNNVDNCARSCHAPSVAALACSLGSGAMTNSITEITASKCLFIIGTNPTQSYPVLGMRIMEAVNNGAKLIVADPRKIDLTLHADLFLQLKPGTDVALLLGMMRVIVDEGLFDREFIEERCENFKEFLKSLGSFELETAQEITGLNRDEIEKAARIYAEADSSAIFYSLGVTEHSHGTDNVLALSNLALLTGNIGKPFSGVNPIRGQNNVQGSCDMGCLPDVYPGYQKVEEADKTNKFQKAWKKQLSSKMGLKMPEMMEAAQGGKVKAMYIMGENPALSEPDSANIIKSLGELDFLIVQDIFLTETALKADLVLPGASFAEKEGTFTNADRRVQRVRQAIKPIGESKPDWQIISELAQIMGEEGFDFISAMEVANEISLIAPIYAGMKHNCLEDKGKQWPCLNEEHGGTPILHKNQFLTANGKAKFIPVFYKPPLELTDDKYPFVLTTGRIIFHYHTSTMTGAVKGLRELYDLDPVEISPYDAKKLNLAPDDWVWVSSRRGKIKARVEITERSPEGLVFMAFHSPDTNTNKITNSEGDNITKTPEFKYCAVNIKKI